MWSTTSGGGVAACGSACSQRATGPTALAPARASAPPPPSWETSFSCLADGTQKWLAVEAQSLMTCGACGWERWSGSGWRIACHAGPPRAMLPASRTRRTGRASSFTPSGAPLRWLCSTPNHAKRQKCPPVDPRRRHAGFMRPQPRARKCSSSAAQLKMVR